MRLFFTIIIIFTFIISCGKTEQNPDFASLTLSEQIDYLIENNEYESALDLLESEDRSDLEIRTLLEKTHLNYGLYSMNTFDQTEMRTRMNNALVQFTEVLRLNPENQFAREQVQQIMAIYSTIPNREPEPEVLEGLREVGFNY